MAAKRDDDEVVYDTAQAAAFIHHEVDTLRRWRTQRKGPAWSKPGRKVLYFRSDLIAYLRACRVDPAA